MSESSAGLVVNLMANDVNRFDTGPIFAHYLWIGPFETMVCHNLYIFGFTRRYVHGNVNRVIITSITFTADDHLLVSRNGNACGLRIYCHYCCCSFSK